MIKRILMICILGIQFISLLAAPNSAAPVIDRFYGYIKGLSTYDYDEAIDLQTKIMDCFNITAQDKKEGFSGVNVVDWADTSRIVTSNLFAQRLTTFIHMQREIRLDDYYVIKSQAYAQPAQGSDDQDDILTAAVSLKMRYRDVPLLVRKELLYICDNHIFKITNYKGSGLDGYNQDEDDISWTIKAAELYSKKKHKEAFEAYKRAVEINPLNMNALYRMAVMTLKGHGTKKSLKVARGLMVEVKAAYWKPNNTPWNRDKLYKQADNAIYYIDHPHDM